LLLTLTLFVVLAGSFTSAAERLPYLNTPAAIVVDVFENGQKTNMFEMWDVTCNLPSLTGTPLDKPSCTITSVMIWDHALEPALLDGDRSQVVIEGPIKSDEVRWLKAIQLAPDIQAQVFFVRSLATHRCGPIEVTLTVAGSGAFRHLVDLSGREMRGLDCKTEGTYAASHEKARAVRRPLMNGARR
jgi:hypothetical protein